MTTAKNEVFIYMVMILKLLFRGGEQTFDDRG